MHALLAVQGIDPEDLLSDYTLANRGVDAAAIEAAMQKLDALRRVI